MRWEDNHFHIKALKERNRFDRYLAHTGLKGVSDMYPGLTPRAIIFRAIRRLGSLNLYSVSQAVANCQDLCPQARVINKVLVEFAERFG